MCISNNIILDVEWIPRDENCYAHYLSHIFDFDDWGFLRIVLFILIYCGDHLHAIVLQILKIKKGFYI